MAHEKHPNIASVSWSDHLVFGEGEGRLNGVDCLRRRMKEWRERLGVGVVHWRCTRDRIGGKYYAARGERHFFQSRKPRVAFDDFITVPEIAHELGMRAFLYVSIFDEGWPLLPKKLREVSFHNPMHCQHVSWQSNFSRMHPQYDLRDRNGTTRQWGVLCLGYRSVREHLIGRFHRLLKAGRFDGLFVCLRSQSRPADFADQFGFNEPIRNAYLKQYGRDIWKEDFDLPLWRELQGGFLTAFLAELRESLECQIGLGVPRGDILGPPLGNRTLQWDIWAKRNLIDHLVIDQHSCKCPSMWHDLWPMHRGYGYVQNYVDGLGMRSLEADLTESYGPIFEGRSTKLYVARQWHARSPKYERRLLGHSALDGLVFSTFRHDNPGPVRRDEWRA